MWDASGHDVTRDQVAPIAGVIPTIKVGPGGAPAKASPADDRSQGADPLARQGNDVRHPGLAGSRTTLDVRRSVVLVFGERDAELGPMLVGQGTAFGDPAVGSRL